MSSPALGRHEDDRGIIEDILGGPVDMVTRIFTRQGAVRGNHVHAATTQWTYIIYGSLLVATRPPGGLTDKRTWGRGQMVVDKPGVEHAWRAETDVLVLVFTRGPRAGEDYESDTARLNAPLIAPRPAVRPASPPAPWGE